MCLSHPRPYISLCITQNTSFFAISGYSCTPALNCMRSHGSLAYNCLQCACHRMGQFTGVQNLIEIRQCLRRWRYKIFTGHTFAIQGVRALSCACFQKECICVQCPWVWGLTAVRVGVVHPKKTVPKFPVEVCTTTRVCLPAMRLQGVPPVRIPYIKNQPLFLDLCTPLPQCIPLVHLDCTA